MQIGQSRDIQVAANDGATISWIARMRQSWLGAPWSSSDETPRAMKLEWRFVTIRWVGIICMAPGLYLFNLPAGQLKAAYGVLLMAALYNIVVQQLLRRQSKVFVSGYVTTIGDGLLNVAMIVVAGGFDTPFYVLLFSATVSAAMRYGYGPVLATSFTYVVADLVEGLFFRPDLGAGFLLRSVFLMLTAVVAAYLHEQAQEAEAALAEQLAQAKSLNKELEAFSYSVSHDLRAPLRSIDGFSRALLEDYLEVLDEDGQDYLNRVRAASQRMAQLIDDLLDLSRVTRSEIHREALDVSEIARSILDTLQASDTARQVQVAVAPAISADGDERMVRVVLENLLNNAWKFTENEAVARIEFGSNWQGTEQVYFVKDNGVGFDMAYSDKLFGAFQRLHSLNDFDGNGIGLATVQRIIHRHGGRVWAESEVGQGATFYFTL